MNVNFRLRKIIFLNYFVFHLPKEQQENQSAKLQKDFYLEQEDMLLTIGIFPRIFFNHIYKGKALGEIYAITCSVFLEILLRFFVYYKFCH